MLVTDSTRMMVVQYQTMSCWNQQRWENRIPYFDSEDLNPSSEGLNYSEDALRRRAGVVQRRVEVAATSKPHSTKQSEPDSRSKSTAESFIINTWLVSCAAPDSRFASASPGSVAAYHGALSRLRLGFKSRLGRFIFACN